ncbi:MAG: DUF2752 domain-containing protein [Weeksellaceae bacterium]|jgi:hypothetical protein|nr:DUF2752 domain-containing protein [Weeksellaceae bacterium]MDX9705333.1 DUF2752 domain-containing protein [Weeksellaceae bacterium]
MNSNKIKYGIISLTLLLSGAFLYYFYTYNPDVESSKFIACPSKTFFGLNCPGCGSQRMIHHLLHFEFKQAFHYNPLLFISLPFVIFLLAQTFSNWVLGTNYRTQLFYSNLFVWFLFGLLIVYAILRNIPFFSLIYLP